MALSPNLVIFSKARGIVTQLGWIRAGPQVLETQPGMALGARGAAYQVVLLIFAIAYFCYS